jgi:Protein of unknown function (DUF4446)
VSLDPSATSIVAVAAAAAGLLGLILGLVAQFRIRRLRRAYSVLQPEGDHRESLVQVAGRTNQQVLDLRAEIATLTAELSDIRVDVADAIRHVAVVRYDAFGDMGGRLSFSTALLDDSGDGLVVTSINGRSETRTYAKGIKNGSAEAQLSPEEEQVVAWARRGEGGVPPARARSAESSGVTTRVRPALVSDPGPDSPAASA